MSMRFSIALVMLLSAAAAFSHEGHLGDVFHAHSLPEAMKLAEREHKLIFLIVESPGRTISYFARPAAREESLIDLLIQETIITPVDRDSAAGALGEHSIEIGDVPVMYLLDADARVKCRFDGQTSAARLLRDLERELRGDDALERVRSALSARGAEDFPTRERLARTLLRRGDKAGVAELRWCIERSLTDRGGLPVGRRRLLFRALCDVGARFVEAKQALREINDALESRLRQGNGDALLARDWADLNHWIGDDSRVMKLFEDNATPDPIKHGLFDRAFPLLVESRRYSLVLRYVDPLPAFHGEAARATGRGMLWAGQGEGGIERGTRAFAVARGAALVEVLAAEGRLDEAAKLVDAVQLFDSRPLVRELLLRHAQRAGHPELLDHSAPTTAPAASQPAEHEHGASDLP